MKLYEKPYLTIIYDEELNCIQQDWQGYAKSEDFREGILISLEFLKEKKADKVLSNTKEFSLVQQADTEWVAKEITPAMVKNGMKKMAFIIPSSIFAKISVDNFKQGANDIVTIAYFDDMQKAKDWLLGVGASV